MSSPRRLLAALTAVIVLSPAGRAAEPAAPAPAGAAALFPPDTLAYAEAHDLPALAADLAAVVKGTPLENGVTFVHARRDGSKNPVDALGKRELALVALLAAPETAAEFQKLRGVGGGITGFTERGEPHGAVAVLLGDSPAAALVAKAFLMMSSVRKIGVEVDVPVYQMRQPVFVFDPMDGQQKLDDKPPVEGDYEATYAYAPGLFVVGTNRATVGEVLKRHLGKTKASLADAPVFQEAVKSHRAAGLFFFAAPAALCAKYDASNKNAAGAVESDWYGAFKVLSNVKSVRYAAGSLRFRAGGAALTAGLVYDDQAPVLGFLSGPPAALDLLRPAQHPASVALALNFPVANRKESVLGFLDAVAKSTGQLGKLPSEALKESEARLKLPVGDTLLAAVRGVTVSFPPAAAGKQGLTPVVVLHADTPTAATAWEELIPKLAADLAGGAGVGASTETVDGLRVVSLAGLGLPGNASLHLARKGAAFGLAADRKRLAELLNQPAPPFPAGTIPAAAAPSVLMGVAQVGSAFRLLTTPARKDGPVVPITTVGPGLPPVVPGEEVVAVSGKQKEDEAKAAALFQKALDDLPPATVLGRRQGAEVVIEVWQPRVQNGGLAPVVAAAVGWFDAYLNRSGQPGNGPHPYRGFR